jgi:EAL domain-containing protein (putative c-di-GMP-specific phosphodiesterase class I)
MVADILQTSGLPAGQLHLEITEGALVRAFGPAADTLARLHALGISLAIDDFGTGYSSLSYLQRFPFDVLKIDRSFIEALGRNASARAIVDAMLSMARALKLHVVAEGVETETQLAMLTDLGCPFIQGFLFARPMPLAQLQQLVASDAGTGQSSREASLVTDA